MRSEEKPRNLSRHQYGTLKFIKQNRVTLAYLGHAHGNTLGSVIANRWIVVAGRSEDSPVILTPDGENALRTYTHATLNERAHEGDLTERCARLLRYSRVVHMPKSA
jgi:hypothetical protein